MKSLNASSELVYHRQFVEERKRLNHIIANPPSECTASVIATIVKVADAASARNDQLAQVHLQALGLDFADRIAMNHSSSFVDLGSDKRHVIHFMPWSLVSGGRALKTLKLESLDPADVKVVKAKLHQISSMGKLHDHAALLLFGPAARRPLQIIQRLHSWQVCVAQAVVTLWATQPGGSGGTGGAGAAAARQMLLCDPVACKCLENIVEAQQAIEALPLGMSHDQAMEAFPTVVRSRLMPIMKAVPGLVDEAKDITKHVFDAYVANVCQVLQSANDDSQAMIPVRDLKFFLATAAVRDASRILSEVLNNPAASSNIARR